MSETYRQSSAATPALLEKDPDNRLLARGPRVRLGPEMIRDQALFAAGLLTEEVGGPSVKPYQPPGLWQELSGNNGYVQSKGPDLYRRSLYTFWKRTAPHPYMMNFDSPNREQCAVYETRTNSPLQALDLMNDVTFVEAARKLAERMLAEGGADPVGYGYSLLLGRPLSAERRQVLSRALEGFRTIQPEILKAGDAPAEASADSRKLAQYTGLASLMLNMDEAIVKQ